VRLIDQVRQRAATRLRLKLAGQAMEAKALQRRAKAAPSVPSPAPEPNAPPLSGRNGHAAK
jgi:hypothetical protein